MSSRDWERLGLSSETLSFVKETMKFETATPVQAAVIPLFLGNKDVAVEACTGSGKTLSFAIPIVEMIRRSYESLPGGQYRIRALVLSPTRELASQIHEIIQLYLKSSQKLSSHIASVCFVGGRPDAVEQRILASCSGRSVICVCTPGRAKALLVNKKDVALRDCDILVLDEADRLLTGDFSIEVSQILSALPKQRRTGLFSATLGCDDLSNLVKTAGMRNPARIKVTRVAPTSDSAANANHHELPKLLSNYYLPIEQHEKLLILVKFLKQKILEGQTVIVFFLTCASVEFHYEVIKYLLDHADGLSEHQQVSAISGQVTKLHGRMTPKLRKQCYKKFLKTAAASSGSVLLSTDLVARGIDIENVNWIVQFDCPQDPSFFLHRVGRTARGGKSGNSLAFIAPKEAEAYLPYLANKGVDLRDVREDCDMFSALMGSADCGAFASVESSNMCEYIRQHLTTVSRELLLKGTAGFVSFVRAYQEHKLKFIFDLKKLDLGYVAQSFGVLRIPRVKEILGQKIENFVQSEIAPDSVAFADAGKEAERQQELEAKRVELEATKKTKGEKAKKSVPIQRTRTQKREAKRRCVEDQWSSLQEEERLAKKLRAKKISQEEYDRLVEGIEYSDNGESDDDRSVATAHSVTQKYKRRAYLS